MPYSEVAADGGNSAAATKSKVTHAEFSRRLEQACDANPHCPPLNHGRLGWIAQQLKERFGRKVSNESVRRWLAGEARPRPATLGELATILKVEEAWLSVGSNPGAEKARREMEIAEKGAVNVLAGLIQMCGSHPAYPSSSDTRARDEGVDLYAIIKGAQYAFHVSAGVTDGDTTQFHVSLNATNCVVLGAVLRPNLVVEFFEITQETLEHSPVKSGARIVSIKGDLGESELNRVTTFAERI